MPELKVCNRCGTLHADVNKSTCARCHQPKRRTQQRINADKFYSTPAWRYVREQALHRDHFRCLQCRKQHDLIVHHHIAISDGCDPLDITNLKTLCRSCHARLHQLERQTK